ncbi:hypothetical protein HK100_000867 [Physocladia obscura]|uniref:Cell division control protein 24 OB domain-containing protein n=1 Tax=Physocladia obscura TaxID=109957 RepID=A0AAD5SZG9_9FUNG|nr:hypothetical protein HK100_000867 [Physocladia obscura]
MEIGEKLDYTKTIQQVREIIKPEKPSKSTTATAASAATPQSKIILIDPHGARCMLLCSGQYSSVSILLARGDIIGIHFPYIHADCFDDAATPTIKTAAEPTRDAVREIEYGTWTVLVHFGRDKGMSGSFVVDDAAAVGDWTAGGHENLDESDEDDDCDAVDFSWAPEKLLFGEVRAGMKNISLIGIIVHLTPNIPIQKGDSLSDRFGIRLSDRTSTLTTSSGNSAEKHYSGSSNIVDVTLWSEIGLASRHLQIGQTVLIQNLRTTLIGKPDSGNKCYVVGSLDYGTKIYCLSTLLGILASPAMLKYNTLADAFNIVRGGFSCRATIKAWRCTAEFPNLTEYIHDACNRPLESSPTVPQQNANLFCKFCNSTVPAGGAYYSPIFGLDLVDDSVQYATNKNSARYVATAAATSVGGRKNTNSLQVFVHGNIAQKILGIDKKGVGHDGTGNFGSFLRYTDALDGLVGKQYDFHVSVYSERRSSIVCRRVDAVLAV